MYLDHGVSPSLTSLKIVLGSFGYQLYYLSFQVVIKFPLVADLNNLEMVLKPLPFNMFVKFILL